MKTLIVPTDFSPAALNAMHYAADMAREIHASILLLHVYQVPLSFTEIPVPALSAAEMKDIGEERIQLLKKELEHITSGSLKVYTEVRLGDPATEIENVCDPIQPFAVVMGTHGGSDVERLLLGSTTLQTLRRSKWPVLVIPPGISYHSIKKIGLACDYKEVIDSMPVEFIKTLVTEFGADLHVLHVEDKKHDDGAAMPLESAYLDTLLLPAKPKYHFLVSENVVEGILQYAETHNLDLLIVVPKKHAGWEGLFHRSQSAGVVTRAHGPVMGVRGSE